MYSFLCMWRKSEWVRIKESQVLSEKITDTFHCMYMSVKFNEKSVTLNSEMCLQYVLYLEYWYVQ